ncbi:MAG TPA: glycoside hydrolase family 15 protein [Polyangia bacterium]|nr:glycoside hydrolase family 15 protein [Polyangia bacterium]
MAREAFGAPGTKPTWSSSSKDLVTTALGSARLWATLGHGVVNEVFWPNTGLPQIRDLTFYLVGRGTFVDLKRVGRYEVQTPAPHIPLVTIVHAGDDYRLTLEVVPDPVRDVLLVRFELAGPYALAVVLAPHLGGTGADNTAWTEADALVAQHDSHALALVTDPPFSRPSAGFVGSSDGWQDLRQHHELTWSFSRAERGTVALAAQLDGPRGVMALGFANSPTGARSIAAASIAEGLDVARATFREGWEAWAKTLRLPKLAEDGGREAVLSAAVIKAHEDREYPGALVASLSTPWGNTTDSLGGYHLVWPRDATLAAFALVAAHQLRDATRILADFIATQRPDGHWPQNYTPDGAAYWNGIQLDEATFPVLLAAKLRERGVPELAGTREMVGRALRFAAASGPTSAQDRWEETPGTNPFTLAVVIAALVAGAPWLDDDARAYALDLADDWNERLESFCFVRGTPLAERLGVDGYYVRIAPPEKDGGLTGRVRLGNRAGETIRASALVSMDFSYLPRLGLRDVRDPRIRDTIAVVDHLLRVETPSGALYHRYNDDGYGEKADGAAYDGTGVGRLWPVLTGERGHLALQAGEDPRPYLETMRRCASRGGLLPEQVWDGPPIPARGLAPGRPSGSAMPLLWSHAEYLKLLVASETRRPVELLDAVAERCATLPRAGTWHWRPEDPLPRLAAGRRLAIEDRQPFTLRYGFDGWRGVEEREAERGPCGLWSVTFSPEDLARHGQLDFTRRFGDRWEGADHDLTIGHPHVEHGLEHLGEGA